MEDLGFFSMMDDIMCQGLDVSIEEYRSTIEKCSYWETLFIVSVFLGEHDDKYERAKEIFDGKREYTHS